MNFIEGNNRNQLVFFTLEMQSEQNNLVLFVDAFVDHLDLSQLGFVVSALKTKGRPAFESKLFLKIYLYGYPNWIRSSGRLKKEFIRKMELQCSYNHTNLKGLVKVSGEMALNMRVYNIQRCITILGIPELINRIKNWTPDYRRIFSLFF